MCYKWRWLWNIFPSWKRIFVVHFLQTRAPNHPKNKTKSRLNSPMHDAYEFRFHNEENFYSLSTMSRESHREDLKNLWRQLLMKSILILYSRYYNFEIIMICSRVHRCVKLISFPLETFLYSNTNWWRPTSSKMNDI